MQGLCRPTYYTGLPSQGGGVAHSDSRNPGFRQIMFSETQKARREPEHHCPGPRISFALEHLDKVCWARRPGLGIFALAVTSYTGTRGIAKGRYAKGRYVNILCPFLRETSYERPALRRGRALG